MSDGYHKGDIWELEAILTNSTGGRVNSTSIAAHVTSPTGTTSSVTMSLTAGTTGQYRCNITLSATGYWHAVIRSTGTRIGVQPSGVTVFRITA